MEKVLILDSNSLMNRAFYALPPTLTNNEGVHTNAIYGFTNMLLKMKEDINPDYIVAAFDKKAPTFRHEAYGDYKAGRKKMPEELREQFPLVKEMLNLLGINIYELDGFEADDIIGTAAKEASKNGMEVYIVTGDKDALQLADDNINVIITKKGVSETAEYNKEAFIKEFEVTPTQFIDVKGLMGDKSDNIPGVPGVGEKTAFKLIKEYGSVEEVLKNIDNISGKKLKENLENYTEQAIFSKKLATIMTEVPIDNLLDGIRKKNEINKEGLKELLLNLRMQSSLAKFIGEEEKEEIVINKIESLEQLKDSLKDNKTYYIAYDIEESPLNSKRKINDIIFGGEGKAIEFKFKEFYENEKEEVTKILKEFFEDENKKKVIHDGKSLIKILSMMGIEIKGFEFDTAISAYLIDSSKSEYALSSIIGTFIGNEVSKDYEGLLEGSTYLKKLYEILTNKIKEENMEELYYNIEHPLIFVLAGMENEGFKIDTNVLDELQDKFKKEIQIVENEIYEMADEKFNINSPKQLGKILFEKLDLPVIKKTKTGYSTNADVLDKLRDKHPIIDKITYYRQIAKINSTYVEGMKGLIDVDQSIHTNFNQTVTTTGRLSSTEPNLQNIPIRYEMGREIRKIFITKEESDKLLSCDYSQIELRVLAHMSGDENMINAFKHHSDIHTKTASEVFNVPIDEVTPLMRSRAKAVNFGIVYGISDFSLAQDLNITKKEASEYMSIYFDRYPKIKEYLDKVVKDAKETGYVTTIVNRKRFIPEIKSSNKIVKALGERLAMNAPIQGSAADIIKIAMINVYNRLKEENLQSRLLLQVHDELILNVKEEEISKVEKLVVEEMENVMNLSVPLDVDANFGDTWYNTK
ncbi:DNA polymerase I [Clostridium baratii]|uniref:DNA polymerase I n=1 Tax=Clostridium baratii str. Sullivan TaxID=1415775 RepID=A0A0A7FY56_9CLOT|nr:DNA polymerase I [Clostridium baratii]AIY84533.1 DNA polymerase I [Clostridium baratii str. Sullivan]CUP23909.1 DNA polymerase I [Clostridium baratii]